MKPGPAISTLATSAEAAALDDTLGQFAAAWPGPPWRAPAPRSTRSRRVLAAGTVDLDRDREIARQAAVGLEAFDGGPEQTFDFGFQADIPDRQGGR